MAKFELVSALGISIPAHAPEALRLAAEDLAKDIQIVTGEAVKPVFTDVVAEWDGIVIRVAPKEFPGDAVENYRLHSEEGNRLFIDGSDLRGAIFGIYAFSADWLHVPSDYLWTQLPVRRLDSFAWPQIQCSAGNPALRYRGVFLNDEDLLMGWEPGGTRHIDYWDYQTVISRNTIRKVAETLLRMGYNLVIPSSFIDIRNPAEEMLLEECARRGLILTMHHVEPLGVSAFGFDNYWKARGQTRSYSYFSDPDALREVWRDSIRRWSKYPEVIWQLGLRGRADRPFWEAGVAPESDEERAAMISRVIREQQQLVREVTGDDQAVFSTTLWAEGVVFNRRGLLEIPPDVITVFADNCAGWRLQDDFFLAPNRKEAAYGVYCHHAVIVGTHLAQAIGARDFHRVLNGAMAARKLCYAMFNAANLREFVYGLQATARITRQPGGFSAGDYLRQWVAEHFSCCRDEIAECYQEYFDAFVKNSRGVALCNDGLMIVRSNQALGMLRDKIRPAARGDRATYFFGLDSTHLASLGDMFPDMGTLDELLNTLDAQEQRMKGVHVRTTQIHATLPLEERSFFYAQIVYPSGLNHCFCQCERECHLALQAFWTYGEHSVKAHLEAARHALRDFEEQLVPQYLTGEFRHWYDHCSKVNYRQTAVLLTELLDGA